MAEEYDPFAHRPQQALNTDFAVFMHLVKAAIGSGILFLPHAFSKTGYVSSIICSVVVGLISTHTAVITVQCAQILCRRAQVPQLNFAETAKLSFETGPESIRKYGNAVYIMLNAFVCFVQYQTTVIYALYVATSFQQVIEHFSGYSMDVRIYLLFFYPVYCALALVPNLKYMVPVSVAGAIFLGVGLLITLYYLFNDFPSPGRLDEFTDIMAVPMFCSIFVFALHNMSVILPLENTMKNPNHMTVILTSSMLLNIFLYIMFGFFGYNKYPDACDTVIKNLPLDEVPAQLVKVAVSLSVMFTYGLQYFVPIAILWPIINRRINKNSDEERRNYKYEAMFRIGGVTISTLLAIAIPQMIPLLGLFSALTMTTVMLLFPISIEIATKWNDPGFYLMLTKNSFIFIVWIFALVFGAAGSIWEIIEYYSGEGSESDSC